MNVDYDMLLEENKTLKSTIATLQSSVSKLEQQLASFQKMFFGPKSERIIDESSDQGLFDQFLKEVDELNTDNSTSNKPEFTDVKGHKKKKRKGKRSLEDLIPDDLPEERILIELPEDKRICPKTGKVMEKIDEIEVVKLAFKSGAYYKKIFVQYKYGVKGDASCGVKTTPAPNHAIMGGKYDESFISKIICDRVMLHIPFYRIEDDLKRMDINISRQTLNKLYMQAADILKPVYDLMLKEVMKTGVIFTDDTPVKLQMPGAGKLKEGRMWVYLCGGDNPKYTIFDFTIDRKKEHPKNVLMGYKGYIHADAYKGYDKLFKQEGVIECACWMHIRRKFYEAGDAPKYLKGKVLGLIRKMYHYERIIKNRSADLRLKVRQKLIKKVIDEIIEVTRKALYNNTVLANSKFGDAISYLHNLGDAVYSFITDARLSPDNGESERSLKPLALGRKNWLFAGSKKGGQATGVLLSLVQTCRKEGIRPRDYIDDILRRISDHPASKLHELLPNSNWKPKDKYY